MRGIEIGTDYKYPGRDFQYMTRKKKKLREVAGIVLLFSMMHLCHKLKRPYMCFGRDHRHHFNEVRDLKKKNTAQYYLTLGAKCS